MLEVHDLLGLRVALLKDEFQPAGNYTILLDGKTMQQGIYNLVLKVGEEKGGVMVSKKLVVSKYSIVNTKRLP